jgi:MYXO-CTERM domain-containing protein
VKAQEYLKSLQPDPSRRTEPSVATPVEAPASPVTLGATLADGRMVTIDVALVGTLLEDDGPSFDHWYDARTMEADVILYNGHAGLGENVRTLMRKGAFRANKYVIWAVNGCDTFAYVDRTLADRRGLLNPDDLGGTKYMDTVSNVMGGYFSATPAVTMGFLDAVAASRDPRNPAKTYQQIFEGMDPEQIIVVTGEEDNEFDPTTHPVRSLEGMPSASADDVSSASPGGSPDAEEGLVRSRSSGCQVGDGSSGASGVFVAITIALAAGVRRRKRGARGPSGGEGSIRSSSAMR